jgi:hypothetical protein
VSSPIRNGFLVALALVAGTACGSDSKVVAPLESIAATETIVAPDTADSLAQPPAGAGGLGTVPPSNQIGSTEPSVSTPGAVDPSTAPCTFEAIHAQTGPPPAGITDIDLRCEGDWASWVGKADDPTQFDGYFAVAQRTAQGWKTVNLGTAGVCADGGVPEALWTALNCTE